MTNPTTMTQQEKPKIVDANRRRELKNAAKKGAAGAGVTVEKTNGADKRRERDIAELRQMIGEASTPEEARNIYEKLGKDLIPEERFRELIRRFEEAPVIPPAATEEPPQKTFGEELQAVVEEAAKATPEKTEATAPETEQVEEAEELGPQVRVKVEGQEYPIEAYKEVSEDEATTLLRKALNEEVAKLDQQFQNPALEQFHEQIFRQIETLRKVESGHDPRYELDQALTNGEISQESYDKIVREAEPRETEPTEPEPEPEATAGTGATGTDEKPTGKGRWIRFIRDNMRRLQAERTQARQQKHEEDHADAKARRKQRRERYLEAHPEKREYLEAKDVLEKEAFEPTPQMEQISAEIKQAEDVAHQKWQKIISHKTFNATVLRALPELQLSLRRVEFLRHAFKVAKIQAQTKWEEKRELAKKLLDRGVEESHYGRIHIEGNLPEVNFGSKLKKALENPIVLAPMRKPLKKAEAAKSKPKQVAPPDERSSLNVLLKSLRNDMIRDKIKPDAFIQTMGKIRELKQQPIRGKITPQQFKKEIQEL